VAEEWEKFVEQVGLNHEPTTEKEELAISLCRQFWIELQEIRAHQEQQEQANLEQQEQIHVLKDKISSQVKANSKNIDLIQYVIIGFIGTVAIASAWDWSSSEGWVHHGERLQQILTVLVGTGGLAALGFRQAKGD
jgi:hypothetical protein